MKTSAALAGDAKEALEIVEFDLNGRDAGGVLIDITATGICRTDAYTLDGLTVRASPHRFWDRRRRHRARSRPGVTTGVAARVSTAKVRWVSAL